MSYQRKCLGCESVLHALADSTFLVTTAKTIEYLCVDCYRSMKEFFVADNAHLLGFWTEKANKELGAKEWIGVIEKANKEYKERSAS